MWPDVPDGGSLPLFVVFLCCWSLVSGIWYLYWLLGFEKKEDCLGGQKMHDSNKKFHDLVPDWQWEGVIPLLIISWCCPAPNLQGQTILCCAHSFSFYQHQSRNTNDLCLCLCLLLSSSYHGYEDILHSKNAIKGFLCDLSASEWEDHFWSFFH